MSYKRHGVVAKAAALCLFASAKKAVSIMEVNIMRNMIYSEQIKKFISVAQNALYHIDELDKLKEENPEDKKRIDELSSDIECYDYELVNLLFGPVF